MTAFDFGALQEALLDTTTAIDSPIDRDGIFDRIGKILLVEREIDRLQSAPDTMALIRHILRRETLRSGSPAFLRVPRRRGWPAPSSWSSFGVIVHDATTDTLLIEATPWNPAWLEKSDTPVFEGVFEQRNVRPNWKKPIDPCFKEVSGFDTYVSPGQREAVRSALLLPQGETLIVALPTGSGKSLVAQAPVLAHGHDGALTICIVPTTALVLDQARQMRGMIKRRFPRRVVPELAWHSDLKPDQKNEIKSAIREGRQGIVYCSPEAATGALMPSIYAAAQEGHLAYFVLDEAHLVTQWGDDFRPAFQMLAGLRRGLLAACPPNIAFRTILMSATMTPDTFATLEALFGPINSVQMVASIHLRPEPQYWIHREDDHGGRQLKILEAIRHAPRPFILYVTKREDAKEWARLLRQTGYSRLDCFHGATSNNDRMRIIEQWANNDLDGIVATSAFGVGIDKQDVRTVIHATVPETVDRFYQEIGRGGRDGCPSSSLLIYSQADRETAYRLSAPDLIGDELGFGRWMSMLGSSKPIDAIGELLEVDLNVLPPWLSQQSDYNRSWNMRTLIMMARAGLLQLESRPPPAISRNSDEHEDEFETRSDEEWEHYYSHCLVKLKAEGNLGQEKFEYLLGKERQRSVEAAKENQLLLGRLLSGAVEVSSLLDQLYRSNTPGRTVIVSRTCGGCPTHRRGLGEEMHYAQPPAIGIERVGTTDIGFFKNKFPHIDISRPALIPLPGAVTDAEIFSLLKDLVSLFSIREIGVSDQFRATNQASFALLHTMTEDQLLLLESVEEETPWPNRYQLPRASIWRAEQAVKFPAYLLDLKRPLHVILVPSSTLDPHNPHRRLCDTGTNVISISQFKAGAQL
mgnify:CR=1 FL=1